MDAPGNCPHVVAAHLSPPPLQHPEPSDAAHPRRRPAPLITYRIKLGLLAPDIVEAIEAPESSQLCRDAAGKRHRCGQESAFAPADMIGRSTVTCQPDVPDRDQHIIASCLKGETNPNGWMVTQGWAMAFRKYGLDYIGQEDETRLDSRGI